LISDPDGEFTATAFDQFDIDSKSVFDGGRHTGGTWPVRGSDCFFIGLDSRCRSLDARGALSRYEEMLAADLRG